jgi:hypothetical protein
MNAPNLPAWVPNPRFEDALVYATRAHARQARKGGTVPYLAHILGVAALVIEDGGSEDEAIAALLHDAGEDQGGEPRMRDIEARFGKPVADIVRECSDTLEVPKPAWEERKRRYVAHLATASPAAVRVSLADKIHNARAMAADHRSVGDALWDRFNAPRDQQATYYRSLCAAFRARLGETPVVAQLCQVVDELFGPMNGREILGTDDAIGGWSAPVVEHRVQLYNAEINGTSSTIFGGCSAGGELALTGRDRGAAPLATWGQDEYEFWVTVAPGQKDALLLALIVERFGGRVDAVDRFREWLKARGVPHEFHNWF